MTSPPPYSLIRWDDPAPVVGWVVQSLSDSMLDRLRALTRHAGGGAALVLELEGPAWPQRLRGWQAALVGEGVNDVIAAWGAAETPHPDRGHVAMHVAKSYARLWALGYTPTGSPIDPRRAKFGDGLVSYVMEAA